VIGSDAIVISRAPSVDSLLQDAWLAWQQKDVAQAESLYRQVLERQPSQRDALIGMMAIYQYRDLPAQARDIATRLTQLFPYDQEVKSLVGQIEKNTTAFDSRETQLKLQSQAAPNDASIIYQLGMHYARLQRWSEAQHMFARASQMDGLQAEYFANLAISLDHLGKRESAVAAYQRAIELAQTRPSGVNVEALTQRLSALLE
jgi:tetratricopeptide (TPR) repeat protein